MSKLPMDLSKFKKVHTDGKVSTFRHYEGHELRIAHSKLSSKLRSTLEDMPLHKPKTQKFAEGGNVKNGGEEYLDTQRALDNPEAAPAPMGDSVAARAGTDAPTQMPWDESIRQRANTLNNDMFGDNQVAPTPGLAADPGNTPDAAPAVDASIAPDADPGPATLPQAATGSASAPNALLAALQSQKAGYQGIANASGKMGDAQAQVYHDYQAQQQQQAAKQEAAMRPYMEQNAKLSQDLSNGHINSKHYVNSMSTGAKISTGIGLILGGMGAGLLHQENPVFKALQADIDRDIQAQRDELGKKNNLLKHNIDMMGNVREGAKMTEMQQYQIVKAHLLEEAAKAQSPIAKANAQVLGSQLDLKIAEIAQQGARMRELSGGGAMGAAGADPAKLVPLVVPKEHQAKAFSEIEAAENTRKMAGSILQSFDDAAKANTIMRTGAGVLRTPPEVRSLHQAMQPTFKDLEGTVRQAAMDNTFKNITPAPGDLDSTRAVKRKALEDYLQSKLSAPTARAYGIDLGKFGSTAPVGGGPQQAPGNFGFKPRAPK